MIFPKFVSCYGFLEHFIRNYFRVKLDLDGLRKARYPRITKRAIKRVSGLSCYWDQRQETFVNLGLFQTSVCLVMAF